MHYTIRNIFDHALIRKRTDQELLSLSYSYVSIIFGFFHAYGAKVGASVLSSALARVQLPKQPRPL